MSAALQQMARLGLKLALGAPLGKPEEEGYLARGIKRNEFATKAPAERAVDMLLAKLRGEAIQPEILPPHFAPVKPAPPLNDLSSAVIALVTDGGLVTEGNPEHMEPGRPTRYTSITVANLERLDPTTFDVVHSGYDTLVANQDPNRLVPLDTVRQLEKEGVIGQVYEVVHATGGAPRCGGKCNAYRRADCRALESRRRARSNPYLNVRVQYSLRRGDQQRNRTIANSGGADLHDDSGGQRSGFATHHRVRRHCQSNWKS